MVSLSAAEEALGENNEEVEAKESLSKLKGELLKLSIDITGTIAHFASLSTTALLTREQYGGSMDMLGEVKNMLERYMECAVEIQKCLETAAAEKMKADALTFYKTNSPKLIELKCTFLSKAPIKTIFPNNHASHSFSYCGCARVPASG